MDDDTLLQNRSKSTLLAGPVKPTTARQTTPALDGEAEPERSDDFALLPLPGSAYDAAHSRASNKPLPTLRFIIGDAIRGLPYASLESVDWLVPDKPGASPAIVIRFTGLIAREAVITGRNLLKLYDLLSHHRVSWVRELPKGKDFLAPATMVITSITVNRISEMPA